MPNKETFTALAGSFLVGATHYAVIRSMRASLPDIQGIEEIRTWGEQSYTKRTRPEGVCDATVDYVTEDTDLPLAFASPTPNDPQGPVSPVDWIWNNQKTGSHFRLRFASVFPTSTEVRQDIDGHLEGTVAFQCAKEDVSWYCSGAAPS